MTATKKAATPRKSYIPGDFDLKVKRSSAGPPKPYAHHGPGCATHNEGNRKAMGHPLRMVPNVTG